MKCKYGFLCISDKDCCQKKDTEDVILKVFTFFKEKYCDITIVAQIRFYFIKTGTTILIYHRPSTQNSSKRIQNI